MTFRAKALARGRARRRERRIAVVRRFAVRAYAVLVASIIAYGLYGKYVKANPDPAQVPHFPWHGEVVCFSEDAMCQELPPEIVIQ